MGQSPFGDSPFTLDVATLRHYSSSGNVTAFSVTQDAVTTIWNMVLGICVLLRAFGLTQVKEMVRASPSAGDSRP
jgi:hypothetical protein